MLKMEKLLAILILFSLGVLVGYYYKTCEPEKPKIQLKNVLFEGVECSNYILPENVTEKGNFWVLNNYVNGNWKPGKCLETITYSVTASYPFLDNIPILAERWRGPISVAVFTPGDDFNDTIQSIAYLRKCQTKLIEEYVTFHLFFPENHLPKIPSTSSFFKVYEEEFDCSKTAPYLSNKETYMKKNFLTFPINVARNIAKENAKTVLVFPSDIELYPSYGLIEKFLKMFVTNGKAFKKTVYVTPVFEIESSEQIPDSKLILKELMEKKKALFFHEKMCAACHAFPGQERWLDVDENEEMDVFKTTKRTESFVIWEPFYIALKPDIPTFAERVTWDGLGDKMVQAYILCLLDYDFAVLNNGYLIHKPGIKRQRTSSFKLVEETRVYKQRELKPVLQSIFGTNEHCAL